jgi:DivIVA domain-containing protein
MKKKDPESTSLPPAASPPPRITPEDIQAKEFRIARFRGYKERDVDEFLDQLTLTWGSVLEENRRLRGTAAAPAASGSPPAIGTPDPGEAGRRADEIVQRAREEADRILREARTRVAAIGSRTEASEGERQAVSAFLMKEREFLQSLASLVQGHAEGVKGMAREVFTPRTAAPAPGESDAATATPATEATSQSEPPAEATDEPAAEGAPGSEPILVEEPEPAGVSGREAEGRSESGDRSLRDLFWGEE